MNDLIKVAVYGTLKQGYGNHRLLVNSKLLGTDITEPKWTMLDLGAFPALVHGHNTAVIEVYEVTLPVFESLDRLEGYPSFYNRKEIDTKYGKAWVYYMLERDNYMQTVVESGEW